MKRTRPLPPKRKNNLGESQQTRRSAREPVGELDLDDDRSPENGGKEPEPREHDHEPAHEHDHKPERGACAPVGAVCAQSLVGAVAAGVDQGGGVIVPVGFAGQRQGQWRVQRPRGHAIGMLGQIGADLLPAGVLWPGRDQVSGTGMGDFVESNRALWDVG